MHTAMQRIHVEFGADAMIVSSQPVAAGVEVSFAIDDDIFLAPAETAIDYLQGIGGKASNQSHSSPLTNNDQVIGQASNTKMKAYLDELVEVSESNIKQAFRKIKQVGGGSSEPDRESLLASTSSSLDQNTSDFERTAADDETDSRFQNPFAKPEKRQIFDIIKQLSTRSDLSEASFDDSDGLHDEQRSQPSFNSGQLPQQPSDSLAKSASAKQTTTSYCAVDETVRASQHQIGVNTMGAPETLAQLSASLQSLLLQNQRLEQQILLQHSKQHSLPKAKALQEKSPILQKVFSQVIDLGFNENIAWQCLEHIEGNINFSGATQESDFDVCWRGAMQYCIDQLNQANKGSVESTRYATNTLHSFVGLSGSGKTAALCKIAAEFCLKSLNKPVIIMSFQQQRIAGFEELLYLADLLSVTAIEAVDANTLRKLICKYQNSHLILIDTGFECAADFYRSLCEGMNLYEAEQLQRQVHCHWMIAADKAPYNIQQQLSAFIRDCDIYQDCFMNIVLSRVDQCERLASVLQLLINNRLTALGLTEGCYLPKYFKRLSNKQWISYCIKRYVLKAKQPEITEQDKGISTGTYNEKINSDRSVSAHLGTAPSLLNTSFSDSEAVKQNRVYSC